MNKISSDNGTGSIKPGLLLEPFGWAADALTEMVIAKPNLLVDLLAIDCQRMHLIALALAHLKGEITSDLGDLLVRGPVRTVLELVPTSHPSRVEQVLSRHFPSSVLEPETYRRLVLLLNDENASRYLQNSDYVSDTLVSTLFGLPPPLRNSCIINALDPIAFEYGFSDGLHLLVSRGAAPNLEALISELGSITEEKRLFSRVAELIEALPLPTAFPPPQIEKARRIDLPAEIRALMETRGDRVDDCLGRINAGTCAVYRWEDGDLSAVCAVERYGRLGWFLNDIGGPQNASIDPQQRSQIRSAFSRTGFPPTETVSAIIVMSRQATLYRNGPTP
jgi:hypothetical protein